MKINNKEVLLTTPDITGGAMVVVDMATDYIDPQDGYPSYEIKIEEFLEEHSRFDQARRGWEVTKATFVKFKEVMDLGGSFELYQAEIIEGYSVSGLTIEGYSNSYNYPALYAIYEGQLIATIVNEQPHNAYFSNAISNVKRYLSHLPSLVAQKRITGDQILELLGKQEGTIVIYHGEA